MSDWPSMTEDEMKSALSTASTADRIAELEADLAAMTSRYSRAATDIATLEAQLADAGELAKREENAKEYFMGYCAGQELKLKEAREQITRLQVANNREVERRRSAEMKLRMWHTSGATPAPADAEAPPEKHP